MRLPIKINAILFRKNNNIMECCLFKRIPKQGGFWQTISGGYETTDKELHDTVVREVIEEAGLQKADIVSVTPQIFFEQYEGTECLGLTLGLSDKVWITELFYGVEVTTTATIDIDKNVYPEHDAYKWCSLQEALNLLKWDANKQAVIALHEYIEQQK